MPATVGSGQTVTALYEVVPSAGRGDRRPALRAAPCRARTSSELGFVKIRYKLPKSDTSRLITTPIDARFEARSFEAAPRDARFALPLPASRSFFAAADTRASSATMTC
jgi:Ca-activated chloride channel family protein